jgi:GNAT superfamily N-acetyltransferase
MQDIPALATVELLAAERFNAESLTANLSKHTVPSTKLESSCRKSELWVAESEEHTIVGFLLAERLDDDLHISEMSVIPTHGRQGAGAALIKVAVAHMRAAGYKRITLTTFATVPWNGPFYLKNGFRVMETSDIGIGLAARIEQERELGLIHRVAMCRSEA